MARKSTAAASAQPLSPDEQAELFERIAAAERAKELAEVETSRPDLLKSFWLFVLEFWSVVEPRELIPGWHMRAICDFLERVARGEVRKALINCPPGVSKSLLVCVLWPAWMLARRPSWKGLFTSHNADYASRDSGKCRRVVESKRYQQLFPHVQLQKDVNRVNKFETTAGGVRQAQGVLGATGDRVNCVVVDDCYTVDEYNSRATREAVHRWWREAIPSRLDDRKRDCLLVVMQRMGGNDLSALCIELGYDRIELAAEYDPERPAELAPGDPRKKPGDAMFPELQDVEVLHELRTRDMTEASFQAQYNQRPIDLVGGMFPARWWRWWKPDGVGVERAARPAGCWDGPARPLPAKFDRVVVSVDCAFRAAAHNDWVVMQCWGLHGADRYLLEQIREHLDAVQTAARLEDLVRRRGAHKVIVEGKANGDAVMAMLRGKVGGLVSVDPEGGKEARAFAAQPQVEGGNVFLPEGWNGADEYVTEAAGFPKGKHDDQVDALTQLLNEERASDFGLDATVALCEGGRPTISW